MNRLVAGPRARRAYLATKLAVLGVAALATWPLSRWLGPRAWWAFVVFAAVVVIGTLLVLSMPAGGRAANDRGEEEAGGFTQPPEEPVVLPVEDAIDLHPFSPREIPDVVRDYLDAAHAAGLREVRLIHGRGSGVQRERVRSVLASHPLVASFHDAPPDRGGWGATVAYLREP